MTPTTSRSSRELTPPSTVLVVDDDGEIRHSVMDVLRRAGYEVLGAENGSAGVEAAVNKKPDLVFLDMTMPGGMGGAEVAAEVRRRLQSETMPLVALSAGREPADREKAMSAGCSLYLTKPCPPARLREVVETMLRAGGVGSRLGS